MMSQDEALDYVRDMKHELEGLTEAKIDSARVQAFNAYVGRRASQEEIVAYFVLGGGLIILGGAAITGFVTWLRWLIQLLA